MVFPDEDLQAFRMRPQWWRRRRTPASGCSAVESTRGVPPVLVDGDGTVTEGTYPQTKQLEGGYTVLGALPRGGTGMGCEDRGCLPVRAGGARVPERSRQLMGFDLPGIAFGVGRIALANAIPGGEDRLFSPCAAAGSLAQALDPLMTTSRARSNTRLGAGTRQLHSTPCVRPVGPPRLPRNAIEAERIRWPGQRSP